MDIARDELTKKPDDISVEKLQVMFLDYLKQEWCQFIFSSDVDQQLQTEK